MGDYGGINGIDRECGLKSWGERQLARLFERYGIEYLYEYPLAVMDRGKLKIFYPDFTLPSYGLIVEYFGVNGDPSYTEQMEHKLDVYRQAGIEGLFLNRDSLRGDWPQNILGKIDSTLEQRVRGFRNTAYRR